MLNSDKFKSARFIIAFLLIVKYLTSNFIVFDVNWCEFSCRKISRLVVILSNNAKMIANHLKW